MKRPPEPPTLLAALFIEDGEPGHPRRHPSLMAKAPHQTEPLDPEFEMWLKSVRRHKSVRRQPSTADRS